MQHQMDSIQILLSFALMILCVINEACVGLCHKHMVAVTDCCAMCQKSDVHTGKQLSSPLPVTAAVIEYIAGHSSPQNQVPAKAHSNALLAQLKMQSCLTIWTDMGLLMQEIVLWQIGMFNTV